MNPIRTLTAVLVLGLLAGTARAGVVNRPTLDLAGARAVVDAARAEAARLGTTGVIAVVDDGGQLMALDRIDGTFPAGATISIGKARTAALFRKPTRVFEEIIGKGRTSMTTLPDFTPLQGGIPIVVDGQVVGGVGVSGAASAPQDEELALAGARAVAGPGDHVRFLGGKEVGDAFAKGAPLVETGDYKVHASRRDHPGQAEVHEGETDIVHVLSGRATLVTGGTVTEPRTIAAGEIRGSGIEGGQAQALGEGDVIIVPKGTPHWFSQVPGPFSYYVVKVH